MKTQLRNRSLGNLVFAVMVAASLNVAVSAQPNPSGNKESVSSMERLEIFSYRQEQALKYVAPFDEYIDLEKERAVENLDLIAVSTENTIKYSAPFDLEDQLTKDLEDIADNMMGQLEYHAPFYDEFTNTLAERPFRVHSKSETSTIVDEDCTPQEAWLINAGYYKTTRKSVLSKLP